MCKKIVSCLNPLTDNLGVKSVDYSADFNNMLNKLNLNSYMIADLWMVT